jgi:hypothetical protein
MHEHLNTVKSNSKELNSMQTTGGGLLANTLVTPANLRTYVLTNLFCKTSVSFRASTVARLCNM